ncbi:hypothetical protein [Flavobacterium salmonis]|uniref:Lipoprotein n=1 Tax=Flavobacterium salmonis TaxID=2654844 RepID=A0A6V6Z0Q4_9FLAO|nr:hypothetical protein [Flavobacterium salmonis]CAD0005255.1 hypothetical protein FLAT13_02662 [Flavobacterium salmonis]
MKTLLTLTILILTTFGCANKQTPKDEKLPVTETQEKADTIFRQVSDFPTIKDTTKFIADLRKIFELEVDESPFQKANEKITTFKKVKIYGSDNDYFFIEYDYKVGCGAAFPYKYQLLLTSNGKLVKTLSGQRYEFIEIFKNENPFLMTVVGTSKGNGGHEIFKITNDTLEDVFESNLDYFVRTYDAHEDNSINEPNELNLKVKDYNNDGYTDISFVGKIVLIQGQNKNGDWFDSETMNGKTVTYSVENPFKKIPVEFVFLYNKRTGHFKARENYTEKYRLED